jgi:tRNA1(Val) A37 N6-methylase TrmN6
MSEAADGAGEIVTSQDALLGGRLGLRQPVRGHRVGSDAILLAAAAPAAGIRRLVDVGAGVGAVGLAILQRMPDAGADLIEQDAGLAALARQNAAANGLQERVRVICADVLDSRERRPAGLAAEAADLVVTNPPFFEAGRVRVSPHPGRASAHVFAASRPDEAKAPLEGWIGASLALLQPGGRFLMIHRPETLTELLGAFTGRLGGVAILPIHPRADAPAHRLLVAGVKGAKAPTRLLAGLVLHDALGAFTPRAEALHRGEALIDWGEPPRRSQRSE